jgi:predicted S18 family serine protease
MEKVIIIVAVLVQGWLLYRAAKLLSLERCNKELSGRYVCDQNTIAELQEKLKKAEWREPLKEEVRVLKETISELEQNIRNLSKSNLLKEIDEKEHQLRIAYAEYRQFKHGVEIMLGGKNGTPDR